MCEIEKSCCFTGRRFIDAFHLKTLTDNTYEIIKNLSLTGITNYICGGATGFDTLASQLVLKLKSEGYNINLTLALPCKNQTRRWKKSDICEYERILSLANTVIYISDEYYNGCMQKRNRFMVDNSAHCVFYMPALRGGTAYTVKYALEKNIILHNAMTDNI